MIEYARKKYEDKRRLSFIYLDAQIEELPNELVEQFDNVFSFFCLHWCVNPWYVTISPLNSSPTLKSAPNTRHSCQCTFKII